MYATFWALVPAIVAIVLALVTKEVYSSLFIGVLVGAALNAGFNIEATLQTVFKGGIITQLQDSYYIGILLFLVFLGILVAMMNKAGGSAAFGRWATEHVKSRVGAQLATGGNALAVHGHMCGSVLAGRPAFKYFAARR